MNPALPEYAIVTTTTKKLLEPPTALSLALHEFPENLEILSVIVTVLLWLTSWQCSVSMCTAGVPHLQNLSCTP